MTYSNKP